MSNIFCFMSGFSLFPNRPNGLKGLGMNTTIKVLSIIILILKIIIIFFK